MTSPLNPHSPIIHTLTFPVHPRLHDCGAPPPTPHPVTPLVPPCSMTSPINPLPTRVPFPPRCGPQGIPTTFLVWLFTALLFSVNVAMSDVCIDPEAVMVAQGSASLSAADILYYTTCDAVGEGPRGLRRGLCALLAPGAPACPRCPHSPQAPPPHPVAEP